MQSKEARQGKEEHGEEGSSETVRGVKYHDWEEMKTIRSLT